MAGLLSLLFGRRDAGAILPRSGTTGAALGIVMTIMSFFACLAVWATISITSAAQEWTAGITNTITVQIKPTDDEPVSQEDIDLATAILRETAGIESAEPLDPEESEKLLEPWLGSGAAGVELNLPVLIDVRLEPDAELDLAALQAKLAETVRGATVDDHTRWTSRLLAVSNSLSAIALTVLTLVLVAATAIVVFATRAGLMAHHGIVEILYLSGAQPDFIAAEFEQHFRRLGLRAGLVGLLCALATLGLAYLSTSAGEGAAIPLVPRLAVTPFSFAALAAVPIGAAMVATLTARLTVHRALQAMS